MEIIAVSFLMLFIRESVFATCPLSASLLELAALFLFTWRCKVAASDTDFRPSLRFRAGEIIARLLLHTALAFIISFGAFQVSARFRIWITDEEVSVRTPGIIYTGLLWSATVMVCARGALTKT